MKQIIQLLIKIIMEERKKQIAEEIVRVAKSKIGMDASPNDLAPDELGCAESVSTIFHEIDPTFPIILGTEQLYIHFVKSPKWEKVYDMRGGDVVIYPTGYFYRSNHLKHGHVFIAEDETRLLSNSSLTGKWTQYHTRETARQYYYREGGLCGWIFRKIA